MKKLPKVFIQKEYTDIKEWVIKTIKDIEGLPITEATRYYICSKYNEFKSLLKIKCILQYLTIDVDYNEVEWKLHDMLSASVRSFSNLLNRCHSKLDSEQEYRMLIHRSVRLLKEFDSSCNEQEEINDTIRTF